MKQLPDVYFSKQYGRLYEEIENGKCETFVFSNEYGTVQNTFLKREIPEKDNGITYFDTISPYGYGGPVIVEAMDRERLLAAYEKAWLAWCERERIVSEFVRFHPLVRNDLDFGRMYDAVFDRYTLAVDLTDDFETTQYIPKCRYQIKKACRLGVVCWIDEKCERMDVFHKLYIQTMRKNQAREFYFFSEAYFHSMREMLQGNVFLVHAELEGRIIASSLMMMSDEFVHYHLSATDPAYYGYSANNLILRFAMEYGRSQGRKWFHLGGGLSGDPADGLYKFKRSFARCDGNRTEFWIGRAIRNEKVYKHLVEKCSLEQAAREAADFFPQYRTRR